MGGSSPSDTIVRSPSRSTAEMKPTPASFYALTRRYITGDHGSRPARRDGRSPSGSARTRSSGVRMRSSSRSAATAGRSRTGTARAGCAVPGVPPELAAEGGWRRPCRRAHGRTSTTGSRPVGSTSSPRSSSPARRPAGAPRSRQPIGDMSVASPTATPLGRFMRSGTGSGKRYSRRRNEASRSEKRMASRPR